MKMKTSFMNIQTSKAMFCGIVTLACMILLEAVASGMHFRIWGTFEFTSITSIVALFTSIFVSVAVGNLVAIGIGLSQTWGIAGVSGGLLIFYVLAGNRGGDFFNQAADSYIHIFDHDLPWVILGSFFLWAAMGFFLARGLHSLVCGNKVKVIAMIVGMLTAGIAILYSAYYPLAKSEMTQCEFTHRSIQNLIERLEQTEINDNKRLRK